MKAQHICVRFSEEGYVRDEMDPSEVVFANGLSTVKNLTSLEVQGNPNRVKQSLGGRTLWDFIIKLASLQQLTLIANGDMFEGTF